MDTAHCWWFYQYWKMSTVLEEISFYAYGNWINVYSYLMTTFRAGDDNVMVNIIIIAYIHRVYKIYRSPSKLVNWNEGRNIRVEHSQVSLFNSEIMIWYKDNDDLKLN